MSYFKSSKKFLSVSFYSIIIPCLFFNSAFLATKEPSPPQSNRLVIMLSQNEEDVFSEPLAWTLGSAIGTVPVICSAAYFMNYLKMIQEEFIIEAKDKAEISHDYKQKLLKILSIFNNKFYRLQNSKLLLHIPVSRNMKPDYQGFAELLKYDPRGFLELDFGNFLALKKEFEAISSSEQVKEAIQKLNRLIDDMLEKLKDMFIQESLVMSGESRGQVKYFETGSLTMLQELPTISIRTGDSLCTIEQFEKLLYPPAQQELEAIKKQMLQAVTVHEESFPKKVMSKKIETENFLETLKKSLEKFKKYTDLYVKEYIDQYIEKNKDQLTEKDINLLNAHIKKLEIPFVRHRQQESESAQTIIDDINTLLNNLKNSLNPANSTGSNVTWNNIRAQLGKLIDDHVIYEKPWNILWMGHGAKLDYYRPIIKNNTKYYTNTMIANTDIETLSKLLSVFDVIGTRSLQLWSCYSGGQHREYIVPQFFSLSYPIALLSATDETMTAGNTPQYREYFEKIEESKQKKEDLSWFEDATAWLNYFINRKTLTNIPIIKPSHSDRFYFFEATSKKVEKLLNEKSAINFESNSLSEKDAMALYYGAILENNLITKRLKNSNFIFYNKQNILIYPEVVDIPVIIRPFIIANSSSGNKVVFPFITSIKVSLFCGRFEGLFAIFQDE